MLDDDEYHGVREVPPVTPDELLYYTALGSAAVQHRYNSPNPEQTSITFEDEDGPEETYNLTDTPMNRAALAIREDCNDNKMFHAIMMRILSFGELAHDPRMEEFARPVEDQPEATSFRFEVMEVAATMHFDAHSGYDADKFFEIVKAKVEASE